MTGTVQVLTDAHDAPGTGPGRASGTGTWRLRAQGVRTVTVLELRQRVRSTRWRLSLAIWFVVVALVTWLTFRATARLDDGFASVEDTVGGGVDAPARGPLIFGLVVFFVLLAGLVVAPTLASGAVNGDRTAGTLATLQVTLLSPAEIAVGKLLAGWVAAVAFLVAALPFLVLSLAAGGVRVWSFVVSLLLLVVLLGVVCAVGLGFSALVARTTASALLTYVTVLGLTFGTLILFGLSLPLVSQTDDVPVWTDSGYAAQSAWPSGGTTSGSDAALPGPDAPDSTTCTLSTQTLDRPHTERTWWLLAANPFVVVADAAPSADPDVTFSVVDPLAEIRAGVRSARAGAAPAENWCSHAVQGVPTQDERVSGSPVWPWGLAVNVLLGAGGVWVAVRRLRIPQTRLARGTRVA